MKVRVSTIAFSQNQNLVSLLKESFPNAEVNTSGIRLTDDALIDFFMDAEAIIVGLEKINSSILDKLPNLKFISKYGVGLDNIDLNACKERGIQIGWTGGVNKRSVAEMTLGFMLALIRNLYLTSNQLKNQVWNKHGGFQLSGKTIGIIGLGNIGKDLVSILKPFGCKILANDIIDISDFASENDITILNKTDLIKNSDIISIHTPLNEKTLDLFTINEFRIMKKNSFIINTARGGIINEVDLKSALNDKLILGAAIDVYNIEPPNDLELLEIENLSCTPHIGGNAYEAVFAMGESAINHLVNFKNQIYK